MASPRAQVPPIIGGFPSSSAPTGHETDTEVFEDAEDAADFAARKEDILSERNRLIRTQLLMREQSGDDSKAVSHAMAPSKRYASPVPKPASTVQNANTKAVQSQQSQTLKLRRVFAPSNKMSQFMSSLTGRKPSLLSDPTPAHVSRESLISSAPGLQSHTSYAPSLDQTPHLSQATHASSESHHAPSSYQHQRHQPSMSASEGLYRVHSVPAPQAPAPYIARQPASQVPVGSQSSVYHPLPEPIYTRYLVQSAESLAHGVSETFVDQHGNLYESVGNISSQDLYTPVSDATTAFLSQQTQLYRPFPQTYQPPQQVYPTPYRPAPHILSNQYPQYARRTEIEQVYQEQNAFENEFESQQHLYASADIVADSAELYASEGRDEVPELGQYRVSETQREEGVSWVVVQGRDENGVLVATDASQNTDRYVQGIDGSVGDSMRYLNVVETKPNSFNYTPSSAPINHALQQPNLRRGPLVKVPSNSVPTASIIKKQPASVMQRNHLHQLMAGSPTGAVSITSPGGVPVVSRPGFWARWLGRLRALVVYSFILCAAWYVKDPISFKFQAKKMQRHLLDYAVVFSGGVKYAAQAAKDVSGSVGPGGSVGGVGADWGVGAVLEYAKKGFLRSVREAVVLGGKSMGVNVTLSPVGGAPSVVAKTST